MYSSLQNISPIDLTEDIKELFDNIKSGNTVAFIGAGISNALGYRTWEEGIFSTDENNPGLLKSSGLDKISLQKLGISLKDFPTIIDICSSKLKEKLQNFLIKEFGERKEFSEHLNTIWLWQTNFKHIITTNFDSSLYDAGIFNGLSETLTFPHDNIILGQKRTLVYLHGRAFLIKDDTQDLSFFLNSIIYGKRSYERAYRVKKEIELFVYDLVKNYNVVFIGFSMEDKDFGELFKKIMDAKIAHEQDMVERFKDIKSTNVFIIAEEGELNKEIEASTSNKPMKKIVMLKRMGFKTIPYKKIDEFHKGLTRLLDFIRKNTMQEQRIPIERRPGQRLEDESVRRY